MLGNQMVQIALDAPWHSFQDASNFQNVKITKVILGSFSPNGGDGVVAPYRSGELWLEMLGETLEVTTSNFNDLWMRLVGI